MKMVLKIEVTLEELGQITEAWKRSGLKRLDDLVIQLLKAKATAGSCVQEDTEKK